MGSNQDAAQLACRHGHSNPWSRRPAHDIVAGCDGAVRVQHLCGGHSQPDFDVIVIGGGMYGAYCAAKIYRESEVAGQTPLRVLVLEAGPFLVHEHGQNIPDLGLSNPFRNATGVEQPGPQHLVWGTGWVSNVGFPGTAYCVGGKSLYWGGWCPRLRDPDLDQWPQEVRDYLNNPPQEARNYLDNPPAFGSNLFNRIPGNLDLAASTITPPSSV
jgi:hypothetical protein